MSSTDDAIRKVQAKTSSAPVRAARNTMIAVQAELIAGSPVDKGRFRSNWIASNTVPSSEVVYTVEAAKLAPKNSLHPKPEHSGEAVYLKRTAYRYWLSNNLPYAIAMLAGEHSDQVSPGWVDVRIRRGIRRGARVGRP